MVFYEPPEVGKEAKKDEAYAEVESVKAVSDVYAPLSGEVTEVNSAVAEKPEKINEDPYGEGWMVKVTFRPLGGRPADGRRRVQEAPRRNPTRASGPSAGLTTMDRP